MAAHFFILLLALLLDRVFGDPDWLWRRAPHPVAGFGAAISALDRWYNHPGDTPKARQRNGWLSIAALLLASLLLGLIFMRVLGWLGWLGDLTEIIIVAVFLAQKSLADHVARVAEALRKDGLAGGRYAVSMIVGRDPEKLDESGVGRAAIESLAENFADGVVAPAFWYAVAGLPGLFAYKMLNTADSMIGHKTERHLDFGQGAAKLDDASNWPAARLATFFIACGAVWRDGLDAWRRVWNAVLKDARFHRSPNAGWPEAAMAGALDIALGGPRSYAGVAVRERMMNAGARQNAKIEDIERALALFWRACSALTVAVTIIACLASI